MTSAMISKIIATIFLCFTLVSTAHAQSAGSFDKFVMVVPAYRELYNQNIATMLLSLYEQDLRGLPFEKIDVWIVVNNVASAHGGIRIENRETIEFLNAVSNSQPTRVNKEHRLLREVLRLPIAEKLNIHVIDQSEPGNLERNIGAVRDAGVRAALEAYKGLNLTRILIAHMDADTVFNANYVRSIVDAFTIKKLKFGLLNMSYTDQLDSEPKVYQRKITADYQIAAHSFRLARDGAMPVGGTPRIVSTADALVKVKGVPHETVGEDWALIENLKKAYPTKGLFLDIPVYAKFRAREDGYDAAIYLQDIDEPVQFTAWQLETTELLDETERWLAKGPILRTLYEEAYANHVQQHRLATLRLKSLVGLYVHDQTLGGLTVIPSRSYPALLENSWFKELVTAEMKRSGSDIHRIILRLEKEFPYFFAEPAPMEISVIARLEAATEALLSVPFLNDLASRLDSLPSLLLAFPATTRVAIQQSFIDLDVQWRKATHPAEIGDRPPRFDDLRLLVRHLQKLRPYVAFAQAEGSFQRTQQQMQADVRMISDRADSPAKVSDLIEIGEALEMVPSESLVARAIAEKMSAYEKISRDLERVERPCPECHDLHGFGPKTYDAKLPVFQPEDFKMLISLIKRSRMKDDSSAVLRLLTPLWNLYQNAGVSRVESFANRIDREGFNALKPMFHPVLLRRRNCALLFGTP